MYQSKEIIKKIKQMENTIEEMYKSGLDKMEQGLIEESMIDFQKVLSVNPNHIASLTQISYALYKLNRLEESLIYATKVVELHPDWDSHMERADIKKAMGDFTGEEEDRNKAWDIGKIACWG